MAKQTSIKQRGFKGLGEREREREREGEKERVAKAARIEVSRRDQSVRRLASLALHRATPVLQRQFPKQSKMSKNCLKQVFDMTISK